MLHGELRLSSQGSHNSEPASKSLRAPRPLKTTLLTSVFVSRNLSPMKNSAPKFQLVSCDAVVSEACTRMPFRYGNACLTAAPILHVRVHIETESGDKASGLAADCLPPLWFDKDPEKDYRRNIDDQLTAFQTAKEIYLLLGSGSQTAHDLWEATYPRILDEAQASGINTLTASFGSSFFERALVDAVCQLKGVSFFNALSDNLLGLDTASFLPNEPLKNLWCRHTVGLSDPLTIGEIPEEERLNDGLPQALEEDIEFYGLRYFKVKVDGHHDHDLERLSRIAALVSQRCPNGYSVTLDGNEQYRNLADLEKLLENLRSSPYGEEFTDAILFIEQPLHRDLALQPKAAAGIERLTEIKPVIIDESDDRLDAFSRAVEIGYRGVSHKNCKGIFKSLKNRELVQQLNSEANGVTYFQSGEDLANLPVIPLQQDLATLATLGVDHVERNGHHYYHGLDHLPPTEVDAAIAAHSDLYEEREGGVFLRVIDGSIEIGSVVDAVGYGYDCEITFDDRVPVDQWSFERLEALLTEREEKRE